MSPITTPITQQTFQPIYEGRVVSAVAAVPIQPGTFVVLTGTNNQTGEMQVIPCTLGQTPFGVAVTGISATQLALRDPTSVELRIQIVRKPTIARVVPGAAFSAAGLPVQSDGLGRAIPAGAAEAAFLQTGVQANDNALEWVAVATGTGGNAVTVAVTNPGGTAPAEVVTVVSNAISVAGRTAGGVLESTAAEIIAAIQASTAASALVTVNNAGVSDGSGIVTAFAATNLASGAASGGSVASAGFSTSTCAADDPFVGVAL
jgi:hypothetical protein